MKNIRINLIILVGALFVVNISNAQQATPAGSDQVFTVVDQQPSYVNNGMAGLVEFLGNNLHYPPDARKNKVEGNVYVSCIVEKDGSITGVEVVKGVEKSLDDEAIRVVKLTKWIPGQQNGKVVRTKLVIPIGYKLS